MKKLITVIFLMITSRIFSQQITLRPEDSTVARTAMIPSEHLGVYEDSTNYFWVCLFIERQAEYKKYDFDGFYVMKKKLSGCSDTLILTTIRGKQIISTLTHIDGSYAYFNPDEDVIDILRNEEIVSMTFDNKTYYGAFMFSSMDCFKRTLSEAGDAFIARRIQTDSTVTEMHKRLKERGKNKSFEYSSRNVLNNNNVSIERRK